jgi:hypothetical protein
VTTRPDHPGGGQQAGLLLVFLEAAVPMWAAAAATWPADRLAREAIRAGEMLSRDEEPLLGPGSGCPGAEPDQGCAPGTLTIVTDHAAARYRRADICTAIAKSLALVALTSGGVTWLGHHWCAAPHGNCPGVIPAGWLCGPAPGIR